MTGSFSYWHIIRMRIHPPDQCCLGLIVAVFCVLTALHVCCYDSNTHGGPSAHRIHSNTHGGPSAHRIHSNTHGGPSAHRIHSNTHGGPSAHRTQPQNATEVLTTHLLGRILGSEPPVWSANPGHWQLWSQPGDWTWGCCWLTWSDPRATGPQNTWTWFNVKMLYFLMSGGKALLIKLIKSQWCLLNFALISKLELINTSDYSFSHSSVDLWQCFWIWHWWTNLWFQPGWATCWRMGWNHLVGPLLVVYSVTCSPNDATMFGGWSSSSLPFTVTVTQTNVSGYCHFKCKFPRN